MICAECLATDPDSETEAVTVMGGFAVCETHRAGVLAAFEQAQKEARLRNLLK